MNSIKLYIATTIDGFIAREDGSLDWLEELPNPNQIDYGYADFYATIDKVVIGRKTYEEVLGFGVDWPYEDCTTYMGTSKEDYQPKTNNTEVIHKVDQDTINRIKSAGEKDVWVIGGGLIITEFLNLGAIDEMILCVIPTILGSGIPLFPNHPKETKFNLVKAEPFETGAVILTYKKK
ncbi:MAG: dihydrofolate reductase family protein [Bacteroidota bacterium]